MKSLSMKLYILVLIVFFVGFGCDDLEYTPTNQLTDIQVEGSPELLGNITIGNYSRLKERNYVRLRHFLQELMSDDVTWVKNSGASINDTYGYQQKVNGGDPRRFWEQAYHGIYSTNKVIEAIGDNASQDLLQLKGENLFLRALMHYDLVRIFARPYSQDPENNLGVIIKDNTENTLKPRSTVKETYEFIVSDLLKAAELMKENKSAIFASKEVGWALLARMYLYMENNDKAIEYADKVINSGRYSLASTENFPDYYTMLPENNPETIFAIKRLPSENLGKGGIGSLYNGHDGGWGEIMTSKSYRELIYKNSNDERIKFIDPDFALDSNGNKIPDSSEESGYKVNKRLGYSKYFNLKYTRQEGIPLLSSPVVLRLAEMFLIKAEAFAKKGQDSQAIEMVNTIRERAGLSGGQLFSTNDLKGYDTVLDVVLDERRLELAWEGHRSFDLFRNNRSVDRSYTHAEPWAGPQLIPATSKQIVHFIPESEIDLNPNLVQNPLP